MNTSFDDTPAAHALPSVRKGYVSPHLTIHGSVEQLTMGGANGQTLDQNFKGFNNRNTPGTLALS